MQTRRSWRALWLVLFAVAFGTNVPTPLLLLYRTTAGLDATLLTAVFGVYAAGLLPALLLAGPASDRFGRKPVVAPFVVLALVASALFVPAATSVPLLLASRLLQGAVSGVVFSVGSAWLTELSHPDAPAVAARRVALALSAGWSLGPLTSGLLAQWAPWPTTLPYLLHLALGVPGVVALAGLRDSGARRPGGPVVDLGVPPGAGRAFAYFVAPTALCVFTFPTVVITLLPLLLVEVMRGFDVALTGLVAGVTLATGAAVQPFGRRLAALRAAPVGVATGAAGFALSLLALVLGTWPLLLPVGVLLGAGYGLCLAAGLTATEELAAPTARGALTASFYACAYVGFGAPFLVALVARSGSGFGLPLGVLAVAAAALAWSLAAGPGRRALLSRRQQPGAGRAHVLALLACAVLASCADPVKSAAPGAAQAATPQQDVTLVFGGDVHAEPPIDAVLARGDNPLADLADTLAAADVAVVNVETAVGVRGEPADKSYVFQAPDTLWDAIAEAGVDVVNLANNHALDYGREGLEETIAGARAAGLAVVGAGADAEEAYGPALVEVDGRTVAVVGLTRVMPYIEWAAGAERSGLASAYDEAAAVDAVEQASRVADTVVVTIHWGRELEPCPVDHQLRLASALTEAGAVVVAGHHGHRLQGLDTSGGTVVAYGLGNLVFYAQSAEARTTGLLQVTLGPDGAADADLLPAMIDEEGVPRRLSGDRAEEIREEVATLRPGGGTCTAAFR